MKKHMDNLRETYESLLNHPALRQFEQTFGTVPDLIRCQSINVRLGELASVICPENYVDDFPISAFLVLLVSESVFCFNS